MPWRTEDLLKATEGSLAFEGPNTTHASISTDTRTIEKNSIFVALKGPNHDAHHFLLEAASAGASCLVATHNGMKGLDLTPIKKSGATLVLVDDTLKALGQLARYHLKRCSARVVAITGSNGKTTTRSLTQAVLEMSHKVHATCGNFNNEVGLPLTLFRLTNKETYSVLELGMSAPGEISRLGAICRPHVAVITCIGESHLEGLGDLKGVAMAKGELLDTLSSDGRIILNADDPRLQKLAKQKGVSPIWYGLSCEADVRARDISWDGSFQHFTLCAQGRETKVRLPLAGRFMVSNALAAAAVGLEAGLPLEEIAKGLETGGTESGRLTIKENQSGLHIIDDTYNANPLSMGAALETLKELKGNHRSIAALGDMLELGEEASRYHQELGQKAARSGLWRLYVTGIFSRDVEKGALEAGMAPSSIFTGDKDALAQRIATETASGDWVLVKGSRSVKMEQVVSHLLSR